MSEYSDLYANALRVVNERDVDIAFLKQEVSEAKQEKAELELENLRLRNVLRITHELYANASGGYGLYRPENPHNYSPDLEQCSKEEIEAHSQACEDYAAGRQIKNESWGIGTYCDEFKPAVELLSTPPSTEALAALVEKVEKLTIERCANVGCVCSTAPISTLPTGQIKLEDLL